MIPRVESRAEEHDWGEFSEPEEETLTNNSIISSPNLSRLIRDFIVSPPARVPSLTISFDVSEDSIGVDEPIILSPYSDENFSPPYPGFNQRELEDLADFDEDTNDYSQPRPRNPFTDDEAEEVESSLESFDSDAGTFNYGSEEEPFAHLLCLSL